jgi:hypothetical protein
VKQSTKPESQLLSNADKSITKKLKEALPLVDIRQLDYFPVGADTLSFAKVGLICEAVQIPFPSPVVTFFHQGDTITVVFWAGHPKNDPLIGSSYADVEQLLGGEWTTVLQDLDPATTYHWARDGIIFSKITVTLDTPAVDRSTYRIRHRGHWKAYLTGLTLSTFDQFQFQSSLASVKLPVTSIRL